jgi:drug/metabolite transporter (DMT)-like permease
LIDDKDDMGFRGAIAYTSLALFWAGSFVALTVAVSALGIGLTIGVLGLSGGIGLAVLAVAVGRKLVWTTSWLAVLTWAGLAATIVGSAVYAMSQLGAGLAAVIISAIPLAATVVAQMRGKARVTGLGAVSLTLGIIGLMVVAAFPAGVLSWAFIVGVEVALIATITAGACGDVIVDRLHSPRALETVILAALLVGVAGFAVAPLSPPTGNGAMVVVVIGIGLICAFLTLFALSSASDGVPRRTAATLPGVGTVLALAGAILILHEQVSVLQVVGMLLILAGTGLLRGLVPRWFPASWRA